LQLDLTEAQLERVARDVEEIIGRVRKRNMQLAAVWRRRAK
jgi:hypothetical protein